mgnify:CR=1 FL=1
MVVGLALVTVTVRYLPAIYQSASVLVIAYAILFVPRAMVSLRAGLAAAPPELVEATRSLGASPPVPPTGPAGPCWPGTTTS